MTLSRHKSKLQTLKIHARLIHEEISQGYCCCLPLKDVLSTIDPSLSLNLIIVYEKKYFDPGFCGQSVDMNKGRSYLEDFCRVWDQKGRFKIISEVHHAQDFRHQLVLRAEVPSYMAEYAMEVLKYDVKEYGNPFDSLLPELLVTF